MPFLYRPLFSEAGVVRRKIVRCHRVHVQSSGNGQSTVSTIGAQRECIVLRSHTARAYVAGKFRNVYNNILF